LENIAKTRFGVKNVGSPCESFSIAPGIDRQKRRRRFSCLTSSFAAAGSDLALTRLLIAMSVCRFQHHEVEGAIAVAGMRVQQR
jgi:hypothetical protein